MDIGLPVSKSSFEYNAAYGNQFDLATAIDDDGADTFFGMQAAGECDLEFSVHTVKQEVMTPSTPQRYSSDNSSEYMTPYSSSAARSSGTAERTVVNYESPLAMCRSLSMSDVSADTMMATPNTPRAVSVDGLADIPQTPRAGVDGLSVAMRDLRMSAVKRAVNTPAARRSVRFEGLPLSLPREKQHGMETRLDTVINTPVLELRTRSITRFSQAAVSPPEDEVDNIDSHMPDVVSNIRSEPFEAPNNIRSKSFGTNGNIGTQLIETHCNVGTQPFEMQSNVRSEPFETHGNIRSEPFETHSNIRSEPFETHGNIRTKPFETHGNVRNKPFEVHSNVRSEAFGCGEERKRKGSPLVGSQAQAPKYISMAESLRKFQVETPERFHSKPRTTDVFKRHRIDQRVSMRPTIPQSPALQSKMRARPTHYPTREQVEEREAEEMQSHKVKAHPLNEKVFKTPQLGKRVEKRPTTAIEPFNLTEFKKKELLPAKPTFNFTARPIPRGMLYGPTGLKEKQPAKLTDPITPAFVRRRAGTPHKHTAPVIVFKNGGKEMGTQEIFHFGVRKTCVTPGQHKPTKLQKTEVVPFSFEERNKLIQKKKEEKIQMYLAAEQKAREFHANPLPGRSRGSSTSSVNENRPLLPDQQSLSSLIGDGYAARRLERIRAKEAEEVAELKKLTAFKARPASVVHARPFTVKKAESPLVEICPFEFNTLRRAREREDFDRQMSEKRERFEECRRQAEEELRERELQQLVQDRKQAVHKANPVGQFKPLEVQPSKKPLTVPKSPFVHRVAADQ